MTTTPERTATVEDIAHPDWCELSSCEPSLPVGGHPGDGLHYSRGTMWPSRADSCENTVRLIHTDNYANDGRNHGSTYVQLVVRQTEIQNADGSAMRADTWLTPDDARMLASALNRYAEIAEIEDRVGGHRFSVAEIRDAQR